MTTHEETVLAVHKMLRTPGELPDEHHGDFQVSQLFTVLKRLHMEKGYVLDYVYDSVESVGGCPVLYARRQDEASLQKCEQLNTLPVHARVFPLHTVAERSGEGFFELGVFRVLGHQFLLDWHAHYMCRWPVCGDTSLDRLKSRMESLFYRSRGVPEDILEQVRDFGLEPHIKIGVDAAVVGMVVFSPWRGFEYDEATFRVTAPHSVLEEKQTQVAAYHCGVMF